MSSVYSTGLPIGICFKAFTGFWGVVAPSACFVAFEGLAELLDPFLTVSGMTRIPLRLFVLSPV
jgi:hypothetical protein